MKPKEVKVHCMYSKEGKELPRLLEECFRIFLHRALSKEDGGKAARGVK